MVQAGFKGRQPFGFRAASQQQKTQSKQKGADRKISASSHSQIAGAIFIHSVIVT
ncbi:MAG: hypothetical protein IJL32_10985 [Oscillospiraceae bacterium]|nr:hypothetical protein [Oscillospiraceae bacterium]